MKKILLSNYPIYLCFAVISVTFFSDHLYAQETLTEEDTIQTPDLTDKQRDAFIKSVHSKLWLLQDYISKIANKEIAIEDRMSMVDEAVKLFANEDNFVQVSSKNTKEIQQVPVRTYFHRLLAIKAVKVDITFYEVTKLTSLKQGDDGMYYGSAYMYQDTKIYQGVEAMVSYYDKTIKKVDVMVKPDYMKEGDKARLVMEAKLGNIKVEENLP